MSGYSEAHPSKLPKYAEPRERRVESLDRLMSETALRNDKTFVFRVPHDEMVDIAKKMGAVLDYGEDLRRANLNHDGNFNRDIRREKKRGNPNRPRSRRSK